MIPESLGEHAGGDPPRPGPSTPRPATEPDELGAPAPATPADSSRCHVIPVGPHVIPLPDSIRRAVEEGRALTSPLVGTRVWIERRRGELYLHLGDVDAQDHRT